MTSTRRRRSPAKASMIDSASALHAGSSRCSTLRTHRPSDDWVDDTST